MPPVSAPLRLLCVCNYPANTGYAWDFIEGLYAQAARRLAPRGVETFVAYPRIDAPPRTLDGAPATPVVLDATLKTPASVAATAAFIRDRRIDIVYFTDQPAWSRAYAALRRAGVRRIVVHDHSSGARSTPGGPRRLVKWLLARAPWIVADVVIAVSDYVARRQIESGLMPPGKIVRVWNGLPVPPPRPPGHPLHDALDIDPARPIVACACRCAPEKGVPTLLRAFDRLLAGRSGADPAPVLVYMGDGPQFAEIKTLREDLAARDHIVLTGYRTDAGVLLSGATICVMPSLWQDALPLAVMQPMSLGLPVIASRVGGIPEMIVDGTTGILVPPGDEAALAAAIGTLLDDPARAAAFGERARERVRDTFDPDVQMDAVTALLVDRLAPAGTGA